MVFSKDQHFSRCKIEESYRLLPTVDTYENIYKEPDSKTLSNVGGGFVFQNYNVFEIQFQKLILRCKSMRLAHILSYIASV